MSGIFLLVMDNNSELSGEESECEKAVVMLGQNRAVDSTVGLDDNVY